VQSSADDFVCVVLARVLCRYALLAEYVISPNPTDLHGDGWPLRLALEELFRPRVSSLRLTGRHPHVIVHPCPPGPNVGRPWSARNV